MNLPFLQALTAFGEADEQHKHDDGHQDNDHIKHAIPPHLTKQLQYFFDLPVR